jgi:hypothetical protein
MADGWLPPRAPGAKPPPRFDVAPGSVASEPPPPARPTFVRPGPAAPGKRNAAAVWAVALAVTGLCLLILSLGTFFALTLPLSTAAWILAGRARKQIASGATTQGEGQAAAALWLARIGVIAGVAALVAFIALVALGVDFEQLRDDIQRELDRRRERDSGGGSGGIRTSVEHARAAFAAWTGR